MRKLLFLILLLPILAKGQAPVSPVVRSTFQNYYEPSTHNNWIWNGSGIWWQAVDSLQLKRNLANYQPLLGYTPENVANKTATQSSSATTYPNWLGVTNYFVPQSRTVAGFALTGNVTLASHTTGFGLIGSAYDGSGTRAWRTDTTTMQTVANLFPLTDTRYYTKTIADGRFAPISGSANYIQNQNGIIQPTSVFRISGTGQANAFTAVTTVMGANLAATTQITLNVPSSGSYGVVGNSTAVQTRFGSTTDPDIYNFRFINNAATWEFGKGINGGVAGGTTRFLTSVQLPYVGNGAAGDSVLVKGTDNVVKKREPLSTTLAAYLKFSDTTSTVQTIANFFPKADTRYVTLGTAQAILGDKTPSGNWDFTTNPVTFRRFAKLNGGFYTDAATTEGNLSVIGAQGIGGSSLASARIAGVDMNFRALFLGNSTAPIAAGRNYGAYTFGAGAYTTPATGTNGVVSNVSISGLGTRTSGGATLGKVTALYLNNTNPGEYAMYADTGKVYMGKVPTYASGGLDVAAINQTTGDVQKYALSNFALGTNTITVNGDTFALSTNPVFTLSNLTAANSTISLSGGFNGGTSRTIGVNQANNFAWTGNSSFAGTSTFNGGVIGNSYINITSANNSQILLNNAGAYISRNIGSGDANSALVVENMNTGSTQIIQQWKYNGIVRAQVTGSGRWSSDGINALTGLSDAMIGTTTTGTSITKNTTSGITLTVNSINASNTDNITNFQWQGTTRASISNTGVINSAALTASQAVFTDASKNLVSVATTGTTNVVLSNSPALTGTPTNATPGTLAGAPTGIPNNTTMAGAISGSGANTYRIAATRTFTSADFIGGSNSVIDIYVDDTLGNVTVTIPSAGAMPGTTWYVTKTNISVNTVTIASASTINGGTTLTTQFQGRQLMTSATSVGDGSAQWFNH